jgi:hypothetical protein
MKKKTIQGLGDKNLLSFPKQQSSICQIWQDVNSHMSIQYVNQSESLYLDHFPICWEANGDSKESTCANPLSNSCHRSGKVHV